MEKIDFILLKTKIQFLLDYLWIMWKNLIIFARNKLKLTMTDSEGILSLKTSKKQQQMLLPSLLSQRSRVKHEMMNNPKKRKLRMPRMKEFD